MAVLTCNSGLNGSTFSIGWIRAMGFQFPAESGATLDSIEVHLTSPDGNARCALYEGGALASGPAGASLIEGWESTGATTGWQVLTSASNPSLTSSGVLWVIISGSSSNGSVTGSTSSADAEDAQSARGRFASTLTTGAITPWPSTWATDAGSFSNFWYATKINYTVGGAANRLPFVARLNPLHGLSGLTR